MPIWLAVALATIVMLFGPVHSGKPVWVRILKSASILLALGVVPVLVFLLSTFLAPDWKGACRCGWLSGFIVGKLALTPVVLYATVALCRLELNNAIHPNQPTDRQTIGAVFCGAVTSTLCVALGFFCLGNSGMPEAGILTVLSYIPTWYLWRAIHLARAGLSRDYVSPALKMSPFWIGSAVWSYYFYLRLPDSSPSCFVVTAAARGHSVLVGPQLEFEHCGKTRRATRQLIRFWQFERAWQSRSPRTHRAFRTIYNSLGPHLAARITSPWRADLVFLALKPLEWLVSRRTLRSASQAPPPPAA